MNDLNYGCMNCHDYGCAQCGLSGFYEHQEHEAGAALGDPRKCKRHGTVISSPDGLFDGVCGACEAEMDDDSET